MTSMPASRSARAMIFAPRSWPSRPGLATTTRILRLLPCPAAGASDSAVPSIGARLLHDDLLTHHRRVHEAVDREGALLLEAVPEIAVGRLLRGELALEVGDG